MGKNIDNNQNLPVNFTKQQRMLLGILLFISVLVILLSFWNIKRSINKPGEEIVIKNKKELLEKQKALALQTQVESDDFTKDTDNDGITDFQEINVYKTSPYLEDTDSDGELDKQEIDNGTDPNCAKGAMYCENQESDNSGLTNATANPQAKGFEMDETLATSSVLQPEDILGMKQALIDSGINENVVKSIDDATLGQLFSALMSGEMDISEVTDFLYSQINETDLVKIEDEAVLDKIVSGEATTEELREVLISAGVSEKLVNALKDEELEDFYRKSISKTKVQQIQGEPTDEVVDIDEIRKIFAESGYNVTELSDEDVKELWLAVIKQLQ